MPIFNRIPDILKERIREWKNIIEKQDGIPYAGAGKIKFSSDING